MRFGESSPVDRFFETPAHLRPQLGLDIPVSSEMSEHARKIGSGPTRWADLLIGFSLDDANRQGVAPETVVEALEEGDLALQVAFFERALARVVQDPDQPQFGYDSDARLIGALASRANILSVSGGSPLSLPFSMEYRRQDDVYAPIRATYAFAPLRSGRLYTGTADIPEGYGYGPDMGRQNVPAEMRAAAAFSNYASHVETQLDAGQMLVRATLLSAKFGEIQGRGQA